LTTAGAHHGNESTGRLIALRDGANNGASQKYTAAERRLDVAAATRGRETDLTRGRIVMAMDDDGGDVRRWRGQKRKQTKSAHKIKSLTSYNSICEGTAHNE